jgi:hypothetical protein
MNDIRTTKKYDEFHIVSVDGGDGAVLQLVMPS